MTKSNASNFATRKQFPDDFMLGTATGAFHVEGAWNEDKSPSILDEYFHSNRENKLFRYILDMPKSKIDEYKQKGVEPILVDIYKGMGVYKVPSTAIVDGTNFDFDAKVAADTYHKTDVDVGLLKELGVQVYRFSINPSRIVPQVHAHLPGLPGIEYYNNLIDKLIENGITPMVSLHHYDIPSSVGISGGAMNSFNHKFYLTYARLCFETFGDRVKYWTYCPDLHLVAEGYGSEYFPPGIQDPIYSGHSEYMVLHNWFISTAMVYKLYNEEFKEKQQGQIGFAIDGLWFYPKDPNNPEHQKAVNLAIQSTFGMTMHVYMTGQYPTEVLEAIDKNSKNEGVLINRLEKFTKDEQDLIKGSFDFVVLNYYSSVKVRPLTQEELANELNRKKIDRGYIMDVNDITSTEVYEGFLNTLRLINKVMNKPKIFIGENGFAENEGVDSSEKKVAYHIGILNKLLEALDEDINVFGYCVWSFVDTFEFIFGYRKKFGIYAVDFNDESRPRSKKNSFRFFQQLFRTKKLGTLN